MSSFSPRYWIFSEGKVPEHIHDDLRPKHARHKKNAWAYSVVSRKWYFFYEVTGNWHGANMTDVPKEYKAQLFLIT